MWQTPEEYVAQEQARLEYHHHCHAANTPAPVPYADQDQLLRLSMQQEPVLYTINYEQHVQTTWQIQGSWPVPGPPLHFNLAPIPPLPPPPAAVAAVPPLVFAHGDNRNRAENILDEFGIYFGNNPLNLEALQQLCFVAGIQFIPGTLHQCRFALRGIHMNIFDVVEEGGRFGTVVRTFSNKLSLLQYSRDESKMWPRGVRKVNRLLAMVMSGFNWSERI